MPLPSTEVAPPAPKRSGVGLARDLREQRGHGVSDEGGDAEVVADVARRVRHKELAVLVGVVASALRTVTLLPATVALLALEESPYQCSVPVSVEWFWSEPEITEIPSKPLKN